LAGGLLALATMAGVRYGWRLVLERSMRPNGDGARRMLI
jgi:hypothetical protein